MLDGPVRVLAHICSDALSIGQVHALGWGADDLGEDVPLLPFRDFDSLDEAKTVATRDFPRGTTVNWTRTDGSQRGGFIVGFAGIEPPVGDVAPAFVLWPDHTETYVESREELANAVRDRLDWLMELGRMDGIDEGGLAAGRLACLAALDVIAAGGPPTLEARGPVFAGQGVVSIEPVAGLRWDGFRAGWDEPDEPAAQRHHPVHYDYAGEFQRTWQDAVDLGIRAAREYRDSGR